MCTWDSYSAEFTPVASGVHRLVVTLDTPDVPVLHVRVGDEQKTDGVRAPGYRRRRCSRSNSAAAWARDRAARRSSRTRAAVPCG